MLTDLLQQQHVCYHQADDDDDVDDDDYDGDVGDYNGGNYEQLKLNQYDD